MEKQEKNFKSPGALEYLGNKKGIAPKLIHTPEGAPYIKQDDYWFYVLELLVSFILSVMAGVVAYYICKWFDSEEQNKR